MKTTIIMPAYNVERYIAESVESVLAQSYRDFELVIVDDGSTDRTQAIADAYVAAHPDRVRLVSQPNRVHSRRSLLHTLWDTAWTGGERTVDVHVYRLRAKLGARRARSLRTVRGIGYRWVPEPQQR